MTNASRVLLDVLNQLVSRDVITYRNHHIVFYGSFVQRPTLARGRVEGDV